MNTITFSGRGEILMDGWLMWERQANHTERGDLDLLKET